MMAEYLLVCTILFQFLPLFSLILKEHLCLSHWNLLLWGGHPITMRGIVISVPISTPTSQLPLSDGDAPPYTIRLVDGSTHKVSPDFMDKIQAVESSNKNGFTFPSWLGHSQKVMYLHNGTYVKGNME